MNIFTLYQSSNSGFVGKMESDQVVSAVESNGAINNGKTEADDLFQKGSF
jgi:hypothetical protein